MASNDRSFNPADFEFSWTRDGWYEWDGEKAHAEAKRERDAVAREARKQGRKVKCWSNRGQQITRGGIGSGHPEIDMLVTVYHVEVGPAPGFEFELVNAYGRMLYGC